jgi:cytochrome c553
LTSVGGSPAPMLNEGGDDRHLYWPVLNKRPPRGASAEILTLQFGPAPERMDAPGRSRANMKKIVLTGLAVIALGIVGGGLLAWSGFYSVAASKGHLAIVRWLLEFGMRRSVEFHSSMIETPELNNRALFERGIGHFQGGCAPCHGAPGFPPSSIAQQMLPSPPELHRVIRRWQPNQLFWIIKHGLKYTGMPAWPAPGRDDEIWALVAFLVHLPDINPDEYRRLAMVDTDNIRPPNPAPRMVTAGFVEGDPIACARCHGVDGQGSQAGGVPRIAGQKPDYLAMTLTDYAHGVRPSGIMHPVAKYLSNEERRELADYYASLDNNPPANQASQQTADDVEVMQLGGSIAGVGIPALSIPACEACHGHKDLSNDKNPKYPSLAGQHFAYLQQQLQLWRAAERGGSFAAIMSPVARNMTDEQIRAVSLYYANLSPENGGIAEKGGGATSAFGNNR